MTRPATTSRGSRLAAQATLLLVALASGTLAILWLQQPPRPSLAWLMWRPGLEVERSVWPARPTGTIFHVRDWHTDPSLAGDDRHLADVEAVQSEQVELLLELVGRGHRTVGVEGLTAAGMAGWKAKIGVLKEVGADNKGKLRHMTSLGGDLAKEAARLDRRYRWEVAELGAAARLQVEEGEALAVFPLDDEAALARATPRRLAGGLWEFDPDRVRERRQAIVRNCVATGAKVVVVILGADHDLYEEVTSEAPRWAYVRVTTEALVRRIESPAGKGRGGRQQR